jgi:hypothetical protein
MDMYEVRTALIWILGIAFIICSAIITVQVTDVWNFSKKAEIISNHITIKDILEVAKEFKSSE